MLQYSLFIISFFIHFLRILSLHIFYDCITIIGHSKGELGTINMLQLYSPLPPPSKIVILRPYCHMRLQIKKHVCMSVITSPIIYLYSILITLFDFYTDFCQVLELKKEYF